VLLLLMISETGVSQYCMVPSANVVTDSRGLGYTPEEVQLHLELPSISFVDPEFHLWSCIDGRSSEGILGTPGGDSGEFLLALSVFQQLTKRTTSWTASNSNNNSNETDCDEQEILAIFRDFMDTISPSRQFYMHSDVHALESVAEEVQDFLPEFNITDVPLPFQQEVLNLLVLPNNIGCGHLRNVLLYPELYQVPRNMTCAFIKAFYDYMWNHENWTKLALHFPDYAILNGNHSERAVVNIVATSSDGNSNCSSLAPLIVPRNQMGSIFVNHPTYIGAFRDVLASFFVKRNNNISFSEMRMLMDSLGILQLNYTCNLLASGLPIYTANLSVFEISSEPSPVVVATTSSVLIWILGIISVGLSFTLLFVGLYLHRRYSEKKLLSDFVLLERLHDEEGFYDDFEMNEEGEVISPTTV